MSISKSTPNLTSHHQPQNFSDKIALLFVKFLRFFADSFFAKKYGHRAIVLETIVAVPGMVGGTLQHLKSLCHLQDNHGWIKILLDEAGHHDVNHDFANQLQNPSR